MALQREVTIVVPAGRARALIAGIEAIPGILGLRWSQRESLRPEGDAIVVQVRSRSLHALMRLLAAEGVGTSSTTSISTSYLASVVSPDAAEGVGEETSDSTWEEIELEIGKESNMTVNGIIVMAIAGVLATIGIATNALHLVIGAMVIAPGFEPLTRIIVGVVARSSSWKRGVAHSALAYTALIVAAAATALLLLAIGTDPRGGGTTYFGPFALLPHMVSLSLPSLLASVVAGTGGALLVATDRAVLTAGAMIALALVPAAALIGIAAATMDLSLFLNATLRWTVEIVIVLTGSLAVFAWKGASVQKRRMMI